MTTASPATSADGFHATQTAQRADELVRALFEAVNADDSDGTDAVLSRSLLSYEVHGMRTRTGLKRYFSGLHRVKNPARPYVVCTTASSPPAT
jgi:hypothetical protein